MPPLPGQRPGRIIFRASFHTVCKRICKRDLGQGGALRAVGRRQRSASAFGGPAERAPTPGIADH
jgi:hypothetical protein